MACSDLKPHDVIPIQFLIKAEFPSSLKAVDVKEMSRFTSLDYEIFCPIALHSFNNVF